jgi:DNA-binding NtrC family response regulator
MSHMTGILVVDDEESMRKLLCRALKRAGYDHVSTAADGIEALERLKESSFRLVILDVLMPRMGGMEALLEMRRTDPDLQVIILTGKAQVEAGPFDNLAGKLAVRHVFQKPVDLVDLLAEVDAAMNGTS